MPDGEPLPAFFCSSKRGGEEKQQTSNGCDVVSRSSDVSNVGVIADDLIAIFGKLLYNHHFKIAHCKWVLPFPTFTVILKT